MENLNIVNKIRVNPSSDHKITIFGWLQEYINTLGKKVYSEFEYFSDLKLFKDVINYATLFSIVKGKENMIKKGRKIICANHPDIGKVIGILLKTYPEILKFTIRYELVISKVFKKLGYNFADRYFFPIKNFFIKPVLNFVANTLPKKLRKYGYFPYIISLKYLRETLTSKEIRDYSNKVNEKIEEALINNDAVVVLQFNKKGVESDYHQNIHKFSKTVARTACDLYLKDVDVPIIVNVFKGGKGFFPNPFNPTVGYINKPVFMKDYLSLPGLEDRLGLDKILDKEQVKIFRNKIFSGFTDLLEVIAAYTKTYKLNDANKKKDKLEERIKECNYQPIINQLYS